MIWEAEGGGKGRDRGAEALSDAAAQNLIGLMS